MSSSAIQRSTKTSSGKGSQRFGAEERAAMKERAREVKAAGRAAKVDGETTIIALVKQAMT